ncbi:DUF3131 domain-containing protein [Candidatus Bathycorpusculum sp.]|uniref:DUF3131 domain-containing protein n=1 Tax=Candidatus Bathycorpusculum sp. TaxID=2994959 RepID=UPI00283480CB|nr:DUF3131 domain-containing protein [Candidatus Termitimicrobium sp.]MCL2432173.1 DUF3131 domain-containing protein [Candidatus Termitimicrobium sp.]
MINFQKICVLHHLAELLMYSKGADDTSNRGFNRLHAGGFSRRAKFLMLTGFIVIAVIVAFFVFLPRDVPTSQRDTPINETSPTLPPSNNQNEVFESIKNTKDVAKEAVSGGSPTKNGESTPKKTGVLESTQTIDNKTWQTIAAIVWRYYQPGVGVDENTGLPWSGTVSPYITDWDLGVYIQAVLDAENLELINRTEIWGFNERMDKVLDWLETRELNNAGYPYWFYRSDTGENWHENSDKAPDDYIDIADTGRLFVALNNLREYPEYTERVNDIVLHGQEYNRTNYANIVPTLKIQAETDTGIYAYYILSGFAAFWPELTPEKILDNIFSSEYIPVSGDVALPRSAISCEPLLCAFFEIKNNDPRLATLLDMTYLAHEAYYNISGKFCAFGEGPTDTTGDWQWEWVVLPDGRTWTALNSAQETINLPPMIYTKIAFGFLAIYNTNYARNMCIYLEQNTQDPVYGFDHGVDEAGKPLLGQGTLTNGLILGAARYYIETHP